MEHREETKLPILEDLGRRVAKHRETLGLGIRAAAKEIGISHPTLSRIERGHLPDLENYQRICRWLGENAESNVMPSSGLSSSTEASVVAEVHFRKRATVSPKTAQALAQMILAAQEFLASGK
ncbi:helix-turn-helix domain-containing protein [Edaphobacter flagellatus]|uniref:helix-turn-helix domain-containing protein n=1 Tax=Edaphobacter flagellatus TaxID=1933044 RepID=UPI0036F35EDA